MSDRLPDTGAARVLIAGNLALLILFPLSWWAPLMRAGLLPLFGLSEVSILSGLAALWEAREWALAVLVAGFALVAPMLKTLLLLRVQISGGSARLMGWLQVMGKLAMADIFLIAVYITIAKGIAVGRVETAWGLWLFTGCVLASLAISLLTARVLSKEAE